jgi:hypothetical protein
MCANPWRRALAAIAVFYWAAGGVVSALSADTARTAVGRSVFAVLDDDNSLVCAYGWNSLGRLGTLSNANGLHTEAFKRLLKEDGGGLVQRMETFLSKHRNKNLTPVEAEAESAEFDALRQAALGVPEIAGLLASSPPLPNSVPASDLDQIRQSQLLNLSLSRSGIVNCGARHLAEDGLNYV